jgi:hypothetical protein
MENSMQPQATTDQDKMVPIDTSGESLDIEVKDEENKDEVSKAEVKVEEQAEEKKSDNKEEAEEYSAAVQKRIDKLTYKLRESERQKEEALKYAGTLKKQNEDITKKVRQVDDGYLEEYKKRVGSELDKAQAILASAIKNNDAKAQVEAQKAIAKLTIEEERAKMTEAQRTNEKEKSVQQPQPQPQPQTQPQQATPDPKAVAWAERNEWFGKDKGMTFTAMALHEELINQEGFDGKTDEYYNELDKRIKKEFPHKFEENKDKSSRVVQTVASANRSTKSGRRTVRLTPSQIAIAKKLGVPLEEYAKHVKEA